MILVEVVLDVTLFTDFLQNSSGFGILFRRKKQALRVSLVFAIMFFNKLLNLPNSIKPISHQRTLRLIKLILLLKILTKHLLFKLLYPSLHLILLKVILLFSVIQVVDRVPAENDDFRVLFVLSDPLVEELLVALGFRCDEGIVHG